MNNRTTLSPHIFLSLISAASLLATGCGSDRPTGTKIIPGIRDAGPSATRDGGVGATRDAGPGGTTGCGTNPSGCAANELIGAAPGCSCLNVCETGFIWNAGTQMCDAVAGAVCGNGMREGNEQCDDGNLANGDGCSSTCMNEMMMGNNCDAACQMLFTCTEMQCPGSIVVTDCVNQCNPDPVGFQADLILTLSCTEINDAICIATQETDAGNPCMADGDCNAGTLQPFCVLPVDDMGAPSGWEGGYCTAIGCRADSECGTNKLCVTIDQMGTTACFQGCDPTSNGAGVCRMGYACPDLSGGMNIGACIPNCTSDMDCNTGSTCNLATGQCM